LLLDSDVLLDVAGARLLWLPESGAVLTLCERGEHSGFVSWHSLANIHYCTKPEKRPAARMFIRDLLRFIRVPPTSNEDMLFALDQPMPDLEDVMQVAAAVACRATYIITRNTRHFARSAIPALTPAAFLAKVAR
jgi:hypothetical protein